jgi:hypothetical protein
MHLPVAGPLSGIRSVLVLRLGLGIKPTDSDGNLNWLTAARDAHAGHWHRDCAQHQRRSRARAAPEASAAAVRTDSDTVLI